jgi:hypothetical protein
VIFVRPSSVASRDVARIVDADGTFIGDLLGQTRVEIEVPEGEHTFVVLSNFTDVLHLNVGADRTYYVEVGPIALGGGSYQLLAIKRGLSSWDKRGQWIQQTRLIGPDSGRGQADFDTYRRQKASAFSNWHGQEFQPRLAASEGRIAALKPKDKNKHFMSAEDGD